MHDVELPLYQEFYRTNHPIASQVALRHQYRRRHPGEVHVPRHGGSSEGSPGGPAVGPGSPEASRGSAAAICTCVLRRPAHSCLAHASAACREMQKGRSSCSGKPWRPSSSGKPAAPPTPTPTTRRKDSWEGVLLTFFLTTLPIYMRGQ